MSDFLFDLWPQAAQHHNPSPVFWTNSSICASRSKFNKMSVVVELFGYISKWVKLVFMPSIHMVSEGLPIWTNQVTMTTLNARGNYVLAVYMHSHIILIFWFVATLSAIPLAISRLFRIQLNLSISQFYNKWQISVITIYFTLWCLYVCIFREFLLGQNSPQRLQLNPLDSTCLDSMWLWQLLDLLDL